MNPGKINLCLMVERLSLNLFYVKVPALAGETNVTHGHLNNAMDGGHFNILKND